MPYRTKAHDTTPIEGYENECWVSPSDRRNITFKKHPYFAEDAATARIEENHTINETEIFESRNERKR